MATASGTATDYDDLLSRLVTFLSTGIGGGQNWTVRSDSAVGAERHVYLEGPGLAASDDIFVNIRQYFDVPNQYYNWELKGAVNYDASNSIDAQPGSTPLGSGPTRGGPRLTLFDGDIPYWFVGNGRRFIVVAKVSTTYSTMYGGFYLPYGTPSEIPYPYYISGNAGSEQDIWSRGDYALGSLWDPGEDDAGTLSRNMAYLRHFDGSWLNVANYRRTSARSSVSETNTWPYHALDRMATANNTRNLQINVNPDGTYVLLPVVLQSSRNAGNVYGELEGVFYVTGQGPNVVEDTVTISGVQYLVVQSSYRTGNLDYCAIRLQ